MAPRRTTAKTADEVREAREAKLTELSGRLEGAVSKLVSGEDWAAAVRFAARFRSRSFANTLLIFAQHQDAFEQGRVSEPFPSYVAGYQQWKTLVRQVAKGQAGYMIYAPVTARFATTNPADAGSWRRLDRGERARPGEVVRSKMVGVKPAYVWDVSQTSGEPVPERPRPRLLAGEAPAGLWEGLAAQVREHGFVLGDALEAVALSGANGVTDFLAHTVQVRANMDDAARVKTLAHELAHIELGHEDRRPAGLHRGTGEVEAESVALMVCASFGIDSTDYTVPYVASWSSQVKDSSPLEVIRATGERARTTALAILDRLPEAPVGDGDPPGLERGAGERARERPGAERAASFTARPATTAVEVREPAAAVGR
jgi:hypothetical protein